MVLETHLFIKNISLTLQKLCQYNKNLIKQKGENVKVNVSYVSKNVSSTATAPTVKFHQCWSYCLKFTSQ